MERCYLRTVDCVRFVWKDEPLYLRNFRSSCVSGDSTDNDSNDAKPAHVWWLQGACKGLDLYMYGACPVRLVCVRIASALLGCRIPPKRRPWILPY